MSQLNRVHIAAILMTASKSSLSSSGLPPGVAYALALADNLIAEHLRSAPKARAAYRKAYLEGTPQGAHVPFLAVDGEVLSLVGPTDHTDTDAY